MENSNEPNSKPITNLTKGQKVGCFYFVLSFIVSIVLYKAGVLMVGEQCVLLWFNRFMYVVTMMFVFNVILPSPDRLDKEDK